MAYVVIWGLLAPVLLAAVVEAVAKIVIGGYTGTTELARTTTGTLWTASLAVYYGVQVRFTWYSWFASMKVGNIKQRGKQNAAQGSIAANVKAKGDVAITNINYTSAPSVELKEKTPGKTLSWRRLPDTDTYGGTENLLTRGHIYQFAVINNAASAALLWEAELVAVRPGSVRQYEAAFGEHGTSKFMDRGLRVETHDARRIQFWVNAPLEDVKAFDDAWLYLRFKTAHGPEHVLVQQGPGVEPDENDVLRGLRAPTPA